MRKLSSLTGIRAVAALWVVLFHLRYLFSFGIFNLIIDKGYLGVDFFFVLSGFIITYVHQKDFTHWPPGMADFRLILRFITLRWARMLPVHYATLTFIVLMTWIRAVLVHSSFWAYHGLPGNSNDLILNLFNLQGWGIANHNSWNIPSWSISSEWFAYLLFPIIALLLLRHLKSFSSPLLLITLCFWGFSSFVAAMHLVSIDWTIHYSLIRVTLEFLIGCGLSTLFKKLPENPGWAGALSVLSLLGLLTTFFFHGSDLLALFSLTAFLLSLAYSNHGLSKLFSLAPMLYLGEISYSTYMMYSPLMLLFNSMEFHFHWTQRVPYWILFLSLILAQLCLTSMMYFVVEKPARDWLRRTIIDRYLGVSKAATVAIPVEEIKEPLPENSENEVLRAHFQRSSPRDIPVDDVSVRPSNFLSVEVAETSSKVNLAAASESEIQESLPLPDASVPSFPSWKPFSDEALSYQPFRRILFRPKNEARLITES